MTNKLPTQVLTERLTYDPQTGDITWRVKPCRRIAVGSPAGSWKDHGGVMRRHIGIDGQRYLSSRIAWFFISGEDPDNLVIDHCDGDTTNERADNLRAVTQSINLCNRDTGREDRGVYKRGNKWLSQMSNEVLGMFNTKEEALAKFRECHLAKFGPSAIMRQAK